MGLDLPSQPKDRRDALQKTFSLMFDSEGLRSEMIRDSMMGYFDSGHRDRSLPQNIPWDELVIPAYPVDVEVEEIAKFVPEDCFYLRFGTWKHQIWLKGLLEEFGGDLGRMFSLRGYEARIEGQFLDQLALESSELDVMFGATVIQDVAVIGLDTYFQDGGAVGVLLHARDGESLRKRLSGRRSAFAERNGATIEEQKVGDATVSFLSAPHNMFRSFHVVKGDIHLITNCRRIVEKFLDAADGKNSLGRSEEFQHARSIMPLEDNHTVFVYASAKFFQNLLHPSYQIELRRRNQAISDMQLQQMASLAASAEGKIVTDNELLSEHGFLPKNFGLAPNSNRFELIDNIWIDSVRGARGRFLPIPDAIVDNVTMVESDWYVARANYFSDNVAQLDPMCVGIRRFKADNQIERVVFDARLAPFGKEKYGWITTLLGPPMKYEVVGSPNDIVQLQLSLGRGLWNPRIKEHQVFAAVQDHLDPSLDLRPKSFFDALQTFQEMPGYLGAWPQQNMLHWLPNLGGEPDPAGYTYSPLLKLWRLRWEEFSVLSMDKTRLEDLRNNLDIIPLENPCHVRIKVGNLAGSKLRTWANIINYRRSWQTSLANVRMLNALVNQFHLAPEQAKEVAEQMLDVKLICSLGGEYQLKETVSGRTVWCSTSWPNFLNPALPGDYEAPLLKWFRGIELEITQGETQFGVHGYIDIQRDETEGGLPSINFFKGFSSLLGGSSDQPDEDKNQPSTNGSTDRSDGGAPRSILEPIK